MFRHSGILWFCALCPSSSFSSRCRQASRGRSLWISWTHVPLSMSKSLEAPILEIRQIKRVLTFSASLLILRERKKRRVYSKEEPTHMETTAPLSEDLRIGLLDEGASTDSEESEQSHNLNESSNATLLQDMEVHTLGTDDFDGETSIHSISTTIDTSLLRYLRGKGKPIETIEKTTNTSIKISSMQEAKGASIVVVEGHSNQAVQEALKLIQDSLKEAINSRLQYTHFISLPLAVHPTLVQKISGFQESVLASSFINKGSVADTDETVLQSQSCLGDAIGETSATSTCKSTKAISGIERSIFVKPETFHITVLMLKLWNDDRVKAAAEVLKGIEVPLHAALDSKPVGVRLLGLACMRGKPSKAHVLYACIEETEQRSRLIAACQVIINAFIESGLVLEKDSKHILKLHATIINTTQRKRKKGKSKKLAFDATDILAKFGSEDWGEYPILEAHLSQRFKYNEHGYYHCCAAIPFP